MSRSTTPMQVITGSTDVYLILGDPVEQVRAPETFNLLFARFGIDAVLVPVLVAPENLSAFVKTAFLAKNIKGLWATMPHKEAMVGLLETYSELGQIAGAVNAVRLNALGQLEGGLFDGEGLLASLAYFNMAYTGKRVLILGAGGAAAAIGASLALQRNAGAAAELAFYNPVLDKAQALAARIAAATGCFAHAAASNDPAGFDLVINASPMGMKQTDQLPCDVSRMEPHAAVMDIVMKNQPTPWVRAARSRGLQAQSGFEMLIQQTHLYLDFFGFFDAARMVRREATFLREQIYPAALQDEICCPVQASSPSVNIPVPFNYF
jgi:shikimate dehydrogenase